jgi:hypothetical protein
MCPLHSIFAGASAAVQCGKVYDLQLLNIFLAAVLKTHSFIEGQNLHQLTCRSAVEVHMASEMYPSMHMCEF